MKTLIQDKKTKMYYAVECSENPKGYLNSVNDDGFPNEKDFPYWTHDLNEAYDFGGTFLAEQEMNCLDVTCNGEYAPVIINIP